MTSQLPAFAVSGKCDKDAAVSNGGAPAVVASGSSAVTRSIRIPANAQCVWYEIQGGGGSATYTTAGDGALLKGMISGAAGKTLFVTAGGGGTATQGGRGFGNGGNPVNFTAPGHTDYQAASSGGGGGAGSAIQLDDTYGPAIVIAGGGGGGPALYDMWGTDSFNKGQGSTPYNFEPRGTGGNGGYPDGSEGVPIKLDDRTGNSVSATTGGGATQGRAGAPGVGSVDVDPDFPGTSKEREGAQGGSPTGGPGNTTAGGKGADAVGGNSFSITSPSGIHYSYYTAVSSGAGGGGYYGGGSGGAAIRDFNDTRRDGGGYHQLAVAGGGGGGSSYVGNANGVEVENQEAGTAGNHGGTRDSLGNGGPGQVIIRWWTPS